MSWYGPHPFKTFEQGIEEFFAFVNLPDKPDKCWEWGGTRTAKGYGAFWVDKKGHVAHRLSWRMFFGDMPHDKFVCHKCDNPACVNPFHLFLGTKQDNNLDKMQKNRQARNYGQSNGSAKLTPALVSEIRNIRRTTGLSYKKIAIQFNVCAQTICNIVRGRIWTSYHTNVHPTTAPIIREAAL